MTYLCHMKTYQQLWQSLTPLYDAGEAQAIVRTVLDVKYGMTLTDIICGKVNELSADEGKKLEEIVERLQKAEPVQYILGEADFAGRTFHVAPGVLIPRPETAELCQWIEEDCKASEHPTKDSTDKKQDSKDEKKDSPKRILDICTGSGCIAITLALDIEDSIVEGWDISEEALRIAQDNAKILDAKNVKIAHHDALSLTKGLKGIGKSFSDNEKKNIVANNNDKWDLIVSNPPYICEKEKKDMEKNVLEHEPDIALFVPDEDPLRFYRAIAEYAAIALKTGGKLFFEINPIYEKEMREMLEKLHFTKIETREDAFGKKRMMKATAKDDSCRP